MGFQKNINLKILFEWRENYINYSLMKLFFKPFKTFSRIFEKAHQNNTSRFENTILSLDFDQKNQLQEIIGCFQQFLGNEIHNLNKFLELQITYCKTEWEIIKTKMNSVKKNLDDLKEYQEIKAVSQCFYLKLGYINEFYLTNEEILLHVQTKFNGFLLLFQDLLLNSETYNKKPQKPLLFFKKISKEPYNNLTKFLISAREHYIYTFYSETKKHIGDNKLKDLLRQTQSKALSSKTLYQLYFFLGIGFALLLMIILLIYNEGLDPDSELVGHRMFKYQFPIFRGFLFVVLYLALLALNVYGWIRCQVNYRGVFGFYKHYSTTSVILKRVLFFSSLWLFTFLLFLVYLTYYGSNSFFLGALPIYYIAGLNWLFLIIYLFFPSKKIFNGKGRIYTFKIIAKILLRSWFEVVFPMIFVINQFASFVLAIKDFEYTCCFYVSIWLDSQDLFPSNCLHDAYEIAFIMALLPRLYRVIQCLRKFYDGKDYKQRKLDLINAGKHSTSALVTILSSLVGKLPSDEVYSSSLFYLWITAAAISKIWCYLWDVLISWSLFQKGYGCLRKEMHYRPWVYYSAIILNFFFRITWILNISPNIINKILWRPELSAFILGLCEMVRRTIWNFIRVDKEIVYFPQQYRLIPEVVDLLNEKNQENGSSQSLEIKKSRDIPHSTFFYEEFFKKKNIGSLDDDFIGIKTQELENYSSENIENEWEIIVLNEKKQKNALNYEMINNKISCFLKEIKKKSWDKTFVETEGGLSNYSKSKIFN